MSDSILKNILKLTSSSDLQVKESAIKVLGELKIHDSETIETLKKLLNDKVKNVRLLAIEALAKFKDTQTLNFIDQMIDVEDEYTINALKQYFAQYGSIAIDYIEKLWKEARLEKKQHYLDILYMTKSKKSQEILLESIMDTNHLISNTATKILLEKFGMLEDDFITNFTQKVFSFIKEIEKSKNKLEQYTTVILNIIKILKNIETPASLKSISKLFEFEVPQISTQLSLATIKLYSNEKLAEKRADDFYNLFKKLFELTKTTQLDNISVIYNELYKITLPPKFFNIVTDLYRNTMIFEVKKWIIHYMSAIATPASTNFLLRNLYVEPKNIQMEIITTFKKNPSLSNILIKELYKCKNAEIVPFLVDVLKSYKIIWHASKLEEFVDNGIKLLKSSINNKKNKHIFFAIAKGLFELTGSISPETVRGKLLQEATVYKTHKNFEMAELIFQVLNTSLFATSDTRFEFAIFKLMVNDPQKLIDERLYIISLDTLEELLKIPRFNLLDRLKSQKQYLQPGHYLYIAQNFIKGLPHERMFAKEILKFIMLSYPKSIKTVKAAEELLSSTI